MCGAIGTKRESTGSPKGDLKTPDFETVRAEFDRIGELTKPEFALARLISAESDAPAGPGSREALEAFAKFLGASLRESISTEAPRDQRRSFDPAARQQRQVKKLENYTQRLLRESDHVREQFFLHKIAPELADTTWTS